MLKKYYTPNAYKLVVAGDETKIAEQLAKLNGLQKFTPNDIEKDN